MKRTPLNPGNKGLKRSPLKSNGSALKRSPLKSNGQPLKSKTPLKPRSEKTAKKYKEERIPLVKRLLKERPWCEACKVYAQVDGVVWFRPRPSRDLHEIRSRGRTGGVHSDEWLDPENILCVCRECHTRITDQVKEAEALGFLA
jgi:hypothetical protein